MKENKNPELHIVKPDETNNQWDTLEQKRRERQAFKRKEIILRSRKINLMKKTIFMIIAVIAIVVFGILYVTRSTYSTMKVLNEYKGKENKGGHYTELENGILKYSRDGAAYISVNGKEQWNVSYQMKTPSVAVQDGTAAVFDLSGKNISIFQKEGLIGEINTELPIEKAAVSSQGIVSAILKGDKLSKVVCYDTKGNLLAEHQTSPVSTGYPMDIDISDDGNILLVSYMKVDSSNITSEVAYYDFDTKKGEDKKINIKKDEYKNQIIPSVFFLKKDVSVAVMEDRLVFYKGSENQEVIKKVKFKDKISSVFHDDTYVGVVVKNKGNVEVQLFNKKGKKILSEPIKKEYKECKIQDNQIIMYDGKSCEVITRSGIHKFKGESDKNILNLFPISGFNKYLAATSNGIEKVRFAK